MCAHILVVNDTQEVLDLFEEILSSEGHQVSLYSYAPRELEVIRKLKPDLIIVDCPPVEREEQGWQLVQKIKMSRDLELIPLILATTNIRALERTQGWLTTKGVAGLPKPFMIDDLLRAVNSMLPPAAAAPDAPPEA